MNTSNWKTTLSGGLAAITSGLTVLSMLPSTLGEISQTIPEPYKVQLFKWSLGATIALKIINAFAQADKANLPDTSGASPKLPGVPIIALLLLPAVIFTGCATEQTAVETWWNKPSTQAGVHIAENELLASAVSFGLNITGQELTTGRADLASAGMSTASFAIRHLEQSKDAGNYATITSTINQAVSDPVQARNITSAVLSSVSIAKAKGGDPSGSIEGAANGLDLLAAK